MSNMTATRRLLAGLICAAPLLLSGCAMPHVMGLGSYYRITDTATGRVYYANNVSHEARGAVEFEDSATNAFISLRSAEVSEISKDEYRKGRSGK